MTCRNSRTYVRECFEADILKANNSISAEVLQRLRVANDRYFRSDQMAWVDDAYTVYKLALQRRSFEIDEINRRASELKTAKASTYHNEMGKLLHRLFGIPYNLQAKRNRGNTTHVTHPVLSLQGMSTLGG